MKKINKILSFVLLALIFNACDINDRDHGNVLEPLEGAEYGGVLSLDKALISYVVGDDGTYTASGNVYQGNVVTETIDIYKSFTNTSGEMSNEVLLATVPVSDTNTGINASFTADFKYEDLIDGLLLNGSPLPSNDGDLAIGDSWNLRYVSNTIAGGSNTNFRSTSVSVGTRFAGTYRVIASDYWRINVQSGAADWSGEERVIESVDASTYRHIGVGPFDVDTVTGGFGYAPEEAELYFSITSTDAVDYEGVGNTTLLTQPYMSCITNPGEFNNVPCGATTNYVVRDDVSGKDLIFMTYGYLTPGSGPREFYEVLEKIVD
jgi:hypothetical protein